VLYLMIDDAMKNCISHGRKQMFATSAEISVAVVDRWMLQSVNVRPNTVLSDF